MGRETIIRLAQASADRAAGEPQQDPTQSLQDFSTWFEALLKVDGAASGPLEIVQARSESSDTGDRLGRYSVLRRLGSGGFGIVLHAFDPLLKREVALKLPRPELLAVPDWQQRVLHEAQAAATLDHPGIVPVYEVGAIGTVWYIASAYCDGVSLTEWLASCAQPISERTAAAMVAAVADAVQHAHSRGLLHRDIKAANILIPREAPSGASETAETFQPLTPRLADFGLAVRQDDAAGLATKRKLAGTPGYMAPELAAANGTPASIQSDVYSLGAVLFELLADRSTMPLEPTSDGRGAPRRPDIRTGVDADLQAVITKSMQARPEDRYQSAGQLADDLRAYLAGRAVTARPLGRLQAARRLCHQHPVSVSLAAMLVVAFVAGLSGVLWQWQRAEANFHAAQDSEQQAQRYLAQTERVLLDLGMAIDDAMYWRAPFGQDGNPTLEVAMRHYESILMSAEFQKRAPPSVAMAQGHMARHLELCGDHEQAEIHYQDAIRRWWSFVLAEPDDESYRRWMVQVCYWYGSFLLTNRGLENGRWLIHDGQLFKHIPLEHDLGYEVAADYAQSLFQNGERFVQTGDSRSSYELFSASLKLSQTLRSLRPDTLDMIRLSSTSALRLSRVTRSNGNRQVAQEMLLAALLDTQAFACSHTNDLALAQAFGGLCLEFVTLNRTSLTPDDADRLDVAIDVLERSMSVNLPAPHAALHLAAELYYEQSRHARSIQKETRVALDSLRAADTYCQRLLAIEEGNDRGRILAGTIQFDTACVLRDADDLEEALRYFELAAATWEQRDGSRPRRKKLVLSHAECWSEAAAILVKLERPGEAVGALRRGVAILQGWGGLQPADPTVSRILSRYRNRIVELNSLVSVNTP